jgi:hypothetical protein
VTRAAGLKSDGVIKTGGEFFADGSVLELVRERTEPEEAKLLHWHGKVLGVVAHVEHAGREYAPAAIDPSLQTVLRLPTRVAPPETTESLFMAVHDLLARHLRQPDTCITAMVCAVFASWMSPALPIASVLWIFSPAGSQKNLALQLLGLLSRRPLRLVGLRHSDIARLPMSLQPTLLLDEPDVRPEMQTLLQSTSHRGARIVTSHGLLEFFRPKMVFSQRLPHATALETGCLKGGLDPDRWTGIARPPRNGRRNFRGISASLSQPSAPEWQHRTPREH